MTVNSIDSIQSIYIDSSIVQCVTGFRWGPYLGARVLLVCVGGVHVLRHDDESQQVRRAQGAGVPAGRRKTKSKQQGCQEYVALDIKHETHGKGWSARKEND